MGKENGEFVESEMICLPSDKMPLALEVKRDKEGKNYLVLTLKTPDNPDGEKVTLGFDREGRVNYIK